MTERLAPEQHDTLDDVPEPAENLALVGHGEARAQLAAAYRAGKLPHALLFAGPAGIGKATLAYHLAYHLLAHPDESRAPNELATPDASSGLFRQIASGAHPGVLHLTRPANEKSKGFKTVITVEEIRKVGKFLSMTSHDGGHRVVIVDPADDMNRNAANALLKNLEEPPSRTVFVLIAHSLGSLLPTIRSRCQVVRLGALPVDDLLSILGTLGIEGDARLATEAQGSVRKAILLSRHGGLDIFEALGKAARTARPDVAAYHKVADAVAGRDAQARFELFNGHVLDLLDKAASEAAMTNDLPRAARLSDGYAAARVAIGEAETYNLDRKQHAMSMIHRLHDLLRM